MEEKERIQRLERENQFLRECAGCYALSALLQLEEGRHTEEIADDLREILGRPFEMSSFFLVLAEGTGCDHLGRTRGNELRREFLSALEPDCHTFIFTAGEDTLLLVLITDLAEQRIPEEKLEQIALRLSNRMPGLRLYVSERCSSLGLLRKLYRDVTVLRDSGSSNASVQLVHMGPPESRNGVSQLQSVEQELIRLLDRREFFEAVTMLDRMLTMTLERGDTNLQQLRQDLHARIIHTGRLVGSGVLDSTRFSDSLYSLDHASSQSELRSAIYDIFAILEDETRNERETTNNRKVVSICAYIQEHFREPELSATLLCEMFRLSPAYLSRVFRQELGRGVVEEIHRVRIEAAKSYLENTGKSLNDIAVEVGFSSRGILIRAFKQLEGITPGEYRSRKQLAD